MPMDRGTNEWLSVSTSFLLEKAVYELRIIQRGIDRQSRRAKNPLRVEPVVIRINRRECAISGNHLDGKLELGVKGDARVLVEHETEKGRARTFRPDQKDRLRDDCVRQVKHFKLASLEVGSRNLTKVPIPTPGRAL